MAIESKHIIVDWLKHIIYILYNAITITTLKNPCYMESDRYIDFQHQKYMS